jgi:hypothetical protein
MKISTLIIIIAGFSLLCQRCIAGFNSQKTTNVVVESQSLVEVGRTLSRAQAYGIAICVESGEIDEPRLSFALTNVTLETAMSNIAKVVTNYNWCYDDKANVVNIFPAGESRVIWTIEKLDVREVSLEDILLRFDSLKLKEHGITFFPGRGNLKWLKTPITLKAEQLTARQALNMICSQLPFRARWELQSNANKINATGVLSFRGCY